LKCDEYIEILEIDGTKVLGRVYVLIEHVAELEMDGADLMTGDELLFLHFILRDAIVGTVPF
jgi:hypothetical protein